MMGSFLLKTAVGRISSTQGKTASNLCASRSPSFICSSSAGESGLAAERLDAGGSGLRICSPGEDASLVGASSCCWKAVLHRQLPRLPESGTANDMRGQMTLTGSAACAGPAGEL